MDVDLGGNKNEGKFSTGNQLIMDFSEMKTTINAKPMEFKQAHGLERGS